MPTEGLCVVDDASNIEIIAFDNDGEGKRAATMGMMMCPRRHDNDDQPTKARKSRRTKLILLLSVAVVIMGIILIATGVQRGKNGSSSQEEPTVEEGVKTDAPGETSTHSPTSPTPSLAPQQPHNIMEQRPNPTQAPSLVQELTWSPIAPSPSRPTAPSPSQPSMGRPVITLEEPTYSPEYYEGVTYRPGELTVEQNGLLLSQGLSAKMIARTGENVTYANGGQSTIPFHGRPDFGATFEVTSKVYNPGGWVYAINSEMKENSKGGVGAITFDKAGNVLDYKMVLKNSTMNCGGGPTPWSSWVSCEEYGDGVIYQVDPFGRRAAQVTSFGVGVFESFAYDVRDKALPRFFATEDRKRGALRRFTPTTPNWRDPWQMLHGAGTIEYLVLHPENKTFQWVSDWETAKVNAALNYPNSEGIDVSNGMLYFVCKEIKIMNILNLDKFTYLRHSTTHGVFDGEPDQIERILGNGTNSDILYFTEESGSKTGIHGRDHLGRFFTILEGGRDETTGLTFSPNGEHMYFCLQNSGKCFDVTRDDGLPFFGRSLSVRYHNGLVSKR